MPSAIWKNKYIGNQNYIQEENFWGYLASIRSSGNLQVSYWGGGGEQRQNSFAVICYIFKGESTGEALTSDQPQWKWIPIKNVNEAGTAQGIVHKYPDFQTLARVIILKYKTKFSITISEGHQ